MAHIDSPHWQDGFCAKHGFPSVPCPQCISERDEDIEVLLTPEDLDILDWDETLTVLDLFLLVLKTIHYGLNTEMKNIFPIKWPFTRCKVCEQNTVCSERGYCVSYSCWKRNGGKFPPSKVKNK